ncbi:unnamed protein product [Ectocarpus sp. 12 AP-2014]
MTITYVGTDRPSLSKEAARVAEGAVKDFFSDECVRKGDTKAVKVKVKVKGSREAHEAIRPALQVVGAVPAATDIPNRSKRRGRRRKGGHGLGQPLLGVLRPPDGGACILWCGAPRGRGGCGLGGTAQGAVGPCTDGCWPVPWRSRSRT